jgi:hypothetical protein
MSIRNVLKEVEGALTYQLKSATHHKTPYVQLTIPRVKTLLLDIRRELHSAKVTAPQMKMEPAWLTDPAGT